ncbi:hydrolase [Bifidobacterium lemurum]|uniref:Hydrolase n=1 Tax=Bifidobacterium lemurum TaxID=1603886 RepID=A0A261FQ20_9BIFI|nr:CocE/NonD family hydrolase [Bifidobacterium lemurum]OZG61280.1 hydrolase [Bifidobacterium lemurum]QOL34672.1 CocE/NonD family hydrolase [Bifidobacterium lemurum]
MSDADEFMNNYLANIRRQYEQSAYAPVCEANPKRTETVVCRDGVELTADIYTPAMPGPYPTIVVRCPYPQQVPLWELHGEELARRGYAMVCEWCRGTHTSGGEWEPNVNERDDGADLLAWLEERDWVDVVGLWGTSYLSLACWVMADITTPKVASICANHYGTDRFASAYQKGAFRCDVLTAWAMQNAGHPVEADYLQSALHRPQLSVDEDMWGGRLDWYRDWISHPRGDDPYWDEGFWGLLKSIPAKVTVPMFIQEGWFDHHLGSALTGYQSLNPQAKEHSWLRIGCWNHYFLNPLEGLEPSGLDATEVPAALEWFDLTLKRRQTPRRKVEYYEIGDDSWHTTDHWPPDAGDAAGSGEIRLYLAAGQNEDACGENGLALAPPAEGALEYDYDPNDPVPTRGGEALLTTMGEIGARIQPRPGYRDDVLSFVSQPLDEDLHIQGTIRVELYVSSSAADTAFTAKLMCVDPDGTARNYRSSITTLALDDPDTPDYMPGGVRRVSVDMWDICWKVPAGSRIRCDISSSDFPQYSVHTNTAGLWSAQSEAVTARQTIHMGATTPSAVVLPIATADRM